MKKIIYIIFVWLLISTMLISSYFLYKNYAEDNKQQEIFEQLEDIIQSEQKAETIINKQQEQSITKEININELYKINNDIVAWIKIENTKINYPIMQTKDNRNYYLKRNFYKQYSDSGTPYLAEYCNIDESNNLIIYGHNIKGNRMFGELEKYNKESYYKKHKTIQLYTLKENKEYEIISVFKTVAYSENGFKYYQFYNLENKKEFDTFINKCKELSFYDTGKTAEHGDELITLSTCEYSNKNGRLVVVARKI